MIHLLIDSYSQRMFQSQRQIINDLQDHRSSNDIHEGLWISVANLGKATPDAPDGDDDVQRTSCCILVRGVAEAALLASESLEVGHNEGLGEKKSLEYIERVEGSDVESEVESSYQRRKQTPLFADHPLQP